MTGSLSGKVAIVTGAARNIGRAIALALAGEGATVLVNARSNRDGVEETTALVEAAGGRALVHLADITDEAAVIDMATTTAARLGPPTILVNNAALRKQKEFSEMTLAEWREVTAVILEGAFLCARACVPHMIKAGGGRIVNIGGKSGHTGAARRAHVVASKAGLVGLTKALAVEYGSAGITANCVVPGEIEGIRGPSRRPTCATADGPQPGRPPRRPGGRRGHGGLFVRPGRGLHHWTDHPRQRRRLRAVTVMGQRRNKQRRPDWPSPSGSPIGQSG